MKKSIFAWLAAMMIAVTCQAQNQTANSYLTLKGNLSDVKDTLVLMVREYNESGKQEVVNVNTKNGKFKYKLKLDKPKDIYFCSAKDKKDGARGKIPAMPNETVELNGTVGNYQLKGTGFYQQYVNLHNLVQQYTLILEKAREKYLAKIKDVKDEQTQKSFMMAFEDEMREPQKKMQEDIINYLNTHKSEEATAFSISYLEPRYYEMVMNTLGTKIVNGRLSEFFDIYKTRLKIYNDLKKAEEKVKAGKMAPDFTMKDLNGKDFTLSSLRGKYVILDFWGSWCRWCIKGMPKMKEYYEKYKGKFEIVGIDCNDTEAKWKAAVEKEQLPWIQVKNESNDFIIKTYAVSGFPTKILINPDGTINKTVTGEDEGFYQYLDSLFETK